MKITKIDRNQARPDPTHFNNFDGEVNFQVLVGPAESDDLDIVNVSFSAGARTKPHIHEDDQVLQIVEGSGVVATETERRFVSTGEVIIVPKGVWHWHGAAHHSPMCHLATKKRGKTDWTVEEKNWAAGYES